MAKTDLKLLRSEFEALYQLYELEVVTTEPDTPAEKLVLMLQLQIWLKLRKLDVEHKQKYKLRLTPSEELAFMIYWGQFHFLTDAFTGNLIQKIINTIHPKYL